ncbi:hypothetical protein CSUI_009634 [Cystoisospora suis]|uniref:Uncharacterized protein n=1 Tax=Cystoisospora suis TaxID=483139 RepID=A0A2C6KJI2_9APIC|nr:hypothetical protein CSUI_009634 [Cystoisospora suis]
MKMRLRVGGGRIGVLVRATLFCLSASWVCFVRCETAKEAQETPRNSLPEEQKNVKTCENSILELSAEEGRVFSFTCKDGSKLYPVELGQVAEKTINDQLKKVYQFTPTSGKAQVCDHSHEGDLSELVPNSTLVKVTPSQQDNGQRTEAKNPVFKLTLGPAQDTPKHLCYICSNKPVQTPTRSDQQVCTIFITVPKKTEQPQPQKPPEGPQQQDPQSPSPPQQQDPQPDEPSGSGAFSPTLSGGVFMTLATSALGWMVHM